MPHGARWSKGVHLELRAMEELFNHDDPAENDGFHDTLSAFQAAMEAPTGDTGSRSLMDGIHDLLTFVNGERIANGQDPVRVLIRPPGSSELVPADLSQAMLEAIHRDWFSGACMWRFDSTNSPDQMHEVMRLTGAEIARRRLAGAGAVEIHAQGEHSRMQVRFASEPSSMNPAFRVWIYTPANAGDLDPEEAADTELVRSELRTLAESYPLEEFEPTEPEGLLAEIAEVVGRASLEFLPYAASDVPFNYGSGYELTAPAGGGAQVTPVPEDVAEPGMDQQPGDASSPNGEWSGGELIGWVE